MSVRKLLFWTHLIVGAALGIVIFSMAITGSILAFEPQLVDWSEKDRREVDVTEGAQRLTPSALVEAAQQAKPKAKPTGVVLRGDPKASATVLFGRDGSLYMNPYTGVSLGGASKLHGFMHWIEDWHRWLANRKIGKPVTGAAALAFFALAISGLYLWWPWKKMKFEPGLQGKARDWNWHNVVGFWLSPFFLITTVTGVVMSYAWANNALFRLTGNEPPKQAQESQRPAAEGDKKETEKPKPIAVDLLMERAQSQVSGWKSISLRLPAKPGASATASIEESGDFAFSHRSQLTLDPYTAEVKKWEPYAEQNSGRKARTWVRYLHTGEAGGLIGQMIAFVTALGAALMVWTGFALALRRFWKWRTRTIKS